MIEYIRALAHAVFVTDPELQGYVPGSEIVHRAIDLKVWCPVGLSARARPLVVHAPTRTEIKGSAHVLAAVDQLKHEGLDFDFAQTDNIPHSAARALYEQADVIVDQLLIGWYGVLAVEGMALGKAVVSYVRRDLLDQLGQPLPLAIADPTTVTDVLRGLISDRGAREELGEAGRAYVERIHDADVIAADLEHRYRSLLGSGEERGADYDGIAAFLQMQTEQAADTWDAIARAASRLRGAEKALTHGLPHAKRTTRLLAASDDKSARKHAAPSANALSSSLRQVTAARVMLDRTLGRPETTVSAAAAPSDVEHATQSATSRQDEIPTKSVVRRGAAPVDKATVRDFAADRWGVKQVIIKLIDADEGSWESLGAAVVREPSLGLELFDRTVDAEQDPSHDAIVTQLALATSQAFYHQGNALLVSAAPVNGEQPVIDAKRQVRFARHYYNLRSLLGSDAELIAAGLLQATLTNGASDDTASPFAGESDEAARTRLNDLCWYFVNTAGISRILDDDTQQDYQQALTWFADRLGLWEVPEFRTTRATLSVRIPIRVTPHSQERSVASGLRVKMAGADLADDEIRIFDRASGGIRWIEQTVTGRLDRLAEWDIELRGPRGATVSIETPRYQFDPRRSTPRVVAWESRALIELVQPIAVFHLELESELLARGPVLTPFDATANGYTSRTLNRQIEQLETLERLHPGRGFGERAIVWRGFAKYWAQEPVAD